YADCLAGRDSGPNARALSLYVHLPFCNTVCYYCGCNKVVTKDHSRAAPYLRALEIETDLVAAKLAGSRKAEQLHFGGGTPTFLDADEVRALMQCSASASSSTRRRAASANSASRSTRVRARRTRCRCWRRSASTACRWVCRTSIRPCKKR